MTQITDIKAVQDQSGFFDFIIENQDIASIDSLESAIWVSLLTDARASESQVIAPEHRRGWIGNVATTVEDRQLGGLLWLTKQRRMTQKTLNEVIDYARESLSWMVEDRVAISVNVSGQIEKLGISLNIVITSEDGTTRNQYVQLWRNV